MKNKTKEKHYSELENENEMKGPKFHFITYIHTN